MKNHSQENNISLMHGTTVLMVRKGAVVVMMADGQVTLDATILKANAKKIRKLYHDTILAGFAGSTADAFTLFSRFESKLDEYHGNLLRASVELAKDWRLDRSLRRLEALLMVANKEYGLVISGQGDVIEPDGDAMAIGSGSGYALSAARALLRNTKLSPLEIAQSSMLIASELCIYTNSNFQTEILGEDKK